MKTFPIILFALFFSASLAMAQDTLYVYQGEAVLYKRVITAVDSVTFQKVYKIVIDKDGNMYQTVTIGTQTWMASNLRVTHYRNGESITNLTVAADWAGATFGAWCDYSNSAANGTQYGHLYNWYAVSDSRNIAPVGWHVATDAEWTTLANYVSANLGTSGSVAKALASTTNWTNSTSTDAIGNDLTKNNTSGFTALPGGERYANGTFYGIGSNGYWWTASENNATNAWIRYLYSNYNTLNRYNYTKSYGMSVRCVRDYAAIGYTVAVSTNPSTLLNQPTGGGTFNSGASVTVTAVANIGYIFTNWTENGSQVSTNASYTFTISSNRTLVANFAVIVLGNFSINLSSNPPAGGTTSGGGTFIENSIHTVSASPNTGYTFANWTEGGIIVSTNATYQLAPLVANRTLVANFTGGITHD